MFGRRLSEPGYSFMQIKHIFVFPGKVGYTRQGCNCDKKLKLRIILFLCEIAKYSMPSSSQVLQS